MASRDRRNPDSEPFDGPPDSTVMGHVHLKVAAIDETVAFYRDVLGFELMVQVGAQAAFLAAGGYHHIGANTWESAGAAPAPAGTAALRHATIVLPSIAERERVLQRIAAAAWPAEGVAEEPFVADASGNRLLLAAMPPG